MIKRYNLPILIIPLVLFAFGYITLLSTSPNLVKNHLVYFFIGFLLYLLFSRIDYTIYEYLWKFIYIFALILLFLTYIFAELKLGAARWLQIGPFSFQTSEYAKFAIILSLACFINQNKEEINKINNLIKIFFIVAPLILLIFIQPDLGTSAVLIALSLGMVFYGGLSIF